MRLVNSRLIFKVITQRVLEENQKLEYPRCKKECRGELKERTKIDRGTSVNEDKDYDSLLRKTETIEKEITSVKSETAFLREKLKEHSDILLELVRLVKESMR